MCCFKLQLYEIAPVLRNFPLPFCKAFQYFEGIKNHILKVVDEHKKSRVTGEPRDLIDSYLEEMEKVRHTISICLCVIYICIEFISTIWMAACWSWITSPVAKSCVYGLCAFCCRGVFPVLTLYSPRSIVWGLFFFSSPSSCYAVFFFNSLSSCPVYPLVIYVCCVCMERLMANFTGTCD